MCVWLVTYWSEVNCNPRCFTPWHWWWRNDPQRRIRLIFSLSWWCRERPRSIYSFSSSLHNMSELFQHSSMFLSFWCLSPCCGHVESTVREGLWLRHPDVVLHQLLNINSSTSIRCSYCPTLHHSFAVISRITLLPPSITSVTNTCQLYFSQRRQTIHGSISMLHGRVMILCPWDSPHYLLFARCPFHIVPI